MPEDIFSLKDIVDLVGGSGMPILVVCWLLWFVSRQLWPAALEAGQRLGALTDRAVGALEKLAIHAEQLVEVQKKREPG